MRTARQSAPTARRPLRRAGAALLLPACLLAAACSTTPPDLPPPARPVSTAAAQDAVRTGYGEADSRDMPGLAREEMRCYLAYIELGSLALKQQDQDGADFIVEAQYTLYAAYIVELAAGRDDDAALDELRKLRTDNRSDIARLALSPTTAGPLLAHCEQHRPARQITIKPFRTPTLKDATTDRI